MPTLRIASFNGEWMNDWFTSDADPVAFKPNFTRDGHTSPTAAVASRSAALIRAIDADVIALEEAPSRPGELALFISTYLVAGSTALYSFFLGDSGAQQKLALLYKPAVAAQLAPHSAITDLIDPWQADVDADAYLEQYSFTRTPLVVDLTIGTHPLQVIVMHTKSNFVQNGKQMWQDPTTKHDYVIAALKSRRRNATEGMRVRTYLDARLAQDPGFPAIVLGDLNDGPGLDYFEENYLAQNVTDILVGSAFQPEQIFNHAPARRGRCPALHRRLR